MIGPTVDRALGEQRAWGWVAHLREGGTTPWQEWHERGESHGRYLPGAQQLELLRRLNAAGSPDRALGESVLAASAAGRGRPDLELVGAGPDSTFGPAPVDPAELPAGELVRVAASVLADQVVDAGAPAQGEPARRPGRRGGGAATASSATPSSPTRCAPSSWRADALPADASRASSCWAPTSRPWPPMPGPTARSPRA